MPYVVVGGTRFYDRAEVKDALAYLRALRNPADTESLLRIVNTPARGIGRTSVERVLAAAESAGISFWEALERRLGNLQGSTQKRVAEFVAQTGDWPVDNVEAGLGSRAEPANLSGRYFEAIDVSNGTIYITYGGGADARVRRNGMALRRIDLAVDRDAGLVGLVTFGAGSADSRCGEVVDESILKAGDEVAGVGRIVQIGLIDFGQKFVI